jgi:hypothetical protein
MLLLLTSRLMVHWRLEHGMRVQALLCQLPACQTILLWACKPVATSS